MKEEKKMVEKPAAQTAKVESVLDSQEMKPKQNWLNLDSMEETEVQLNYEILKLKKDANIDAAVAELTKRIGSKENVVEAFLGFLNSQAYQTAKTAAQSKGRFLTPELRSAISKFMKNLAQFAELSAKDAFDRWKKGYTAKKPGAIKILQTVTESANSEFSDL